MDDVLAVLKDARRRIEGYGLQLERVKARQDRDKVGDGERRERIDAMRVQLQLRDRMVARCVQMSQQGRPRRLPRLKLSLSTRRDDLGFGRADQTERVLVLTERPQLFDRGYTFEPRGGIGAVKETDAVKGVQVPHKHVVRKKETTTRRWIVFKGILENRPVP
eukprot:5635544-Prymnesium_polylepis.2